MSIRAFTLLLIVAISAAAYSQDRTQGELRFVPATSAEKNAGVWVDGHYVGFVSELKGKKQVRLLPGDHDIVIRQPWYQDYIEHISLQAGSVHTVNVSMTKVSPGPVAEATAAELKIVVTPDRAAIFIDGQFAGHANEFDHLGQGLLVSPGERKLTIALPGYLPFETTLKLHPRQKLRISTKLTKGDATTAGSYVSPE